MSNIHNTSTLEYYNYGENNMMESFVAGQYTVKVSDKDGNIITIEKDGALFALVGLDFDSETGTLKLTDVAHNNVVLAEVDMPNADYIYNCRFDEETNSILFDVKSLYGDKTDTIELDIESLVDIYEAGQGIEIGEANANGKKPISIKLTEDEKYLKLSEQGLYLDDAVATDEEVQEAVSGKADVSYVDSLFEPLSGVPEAVSALSETVRGVTGDIQKIKDIIGTDEDTPSLDNRIDTNREDIEALDNEVGELQVSMSALTNNIAFVSGAVDSVSGVVDGVISDVQKNAEDIAELLGVTDALSGAIDTANEEIEKNKVRIDKITSGLPANVTEAYVLRNTDGEQLGDRIDIYADSSLKNVELVDHDDQGHEGKFLKFTYEIDGELKDVYVDVSNIVTDATYKDGLSVDDNNVVRVKIDAESEAYLSVSESGLKLSGINSLVESFEAADEALNAAISAETEARKEAVSALTDALNAEKILRETRDGELTAMIENEENDRVAKDNELAASISAETNARVAADNTLTNAIEREVNRATGAENNLQSAIDTERNERMVADNNLQYQIDAEVAARQSGDTAAMNYISSKVDTINSAITELSAEIGAEAANREAADNVLNGQIDDIRANYATTEYVNEQDRATKEAAISDAVASAKSYTDVEVLEARNELKHYCDSGHTQLQGEISENATKINDISNLLGVVGSDTSGYDDSGNGILDVLHREFHEFTGTVMTINETIELKNQPYEMAFGKYNVSRTGDSPSERTVFSVGIGTSSNKRNNALEVRENGDVYMWIEGDFMKVNDLLAMIAHETY